jgi:hypothetical protein
MSLECEEGIERRRSLAFESTRMNEVRCDPQSFRKCPKLRLRLTYQA